MFLLLIAGITLITVYFIGRASEEKVLDRYIYDYNNSKTLIQFMDRRNNLLCKLKSFKCRIYFAKKRRTIIRSLETEYQVEIEKVITNWYKNIVNAMEMKQATYALAIYNNARELYLAIKRYNSVFNDYNKKYSEIISENLSKIMLFTQKYFDASNFGISVKRIDDMPGSEFEKYCASLLMASGFKNVKVTKGSGDQGVDIIGFYNNNKAAIQCKRYSKKLGNRSIQEVVAGRVFYGCQIAIVITNNYFTNAAIELAKANNVILWDRDKLAQMIYETDSQWDTLLEDIKMDE